MMKKLTVVVNDYDSNVKLYISYETGDIDKLEQMWTTPDQRLIDLHCLEPFNGYESWSQLTPEHYRVLISRGLNILAQMSAADRADTKDENVSMTNFIILAFIKRIEELSHAEIEQFRINRFDTFNVTYDFSATFELNYEKPRARGTVVEQPEPAPASAPSPFSIVVDNSDESSQD